MTLSHHSQVIYYQPFYCYSYRENAAKNARLHANGPLFDHIFCAERVCRHDNSCLTTDNLCTVCSVVNSVAHAAF